jgi:hypothetical protein
MAPPLFESRVPPSPAVDADEGFVVQATDHVLVTQTPSSSSYQVIVRPPQPPTFAVGA